jgi:Spy/CpxP family protein refolding chaperone
MIPGSLSKKVAFYAGVLPALALCFLPLAVGQGNPAPPQGGPMPDCCKMMQQGPGGGMGGGMMQPGPGMGPGGARPGLRAAMPRGPMAGPNQDGAGLRMLRRPDVQKELGITDEQRKKLEDLAFNAEKAAIQGRAGMQVAWLELARIESAENPDRAAIDKKIQEISQAQASLMRAEINARLDVRSLLTKEQREKLQNLARNRAANNPMPMRPGQMRTRPGQSPTAPPKPPGE